MAPIVSIDPAASQPVTHGQNNGEPQASQATHYQSDSRKYRSDCRQATQRNPAPMKSMCYSQRPPLKCGSPTAFMNGVQRLRLLAN